MSCCIVALAFAMQLLATWRRVKAWLGIQARDEAIGDHGIGTVLANGLEHLRSPRWRFVVLAMLVVEGAWAGDWLYAHRVHLGNELAAFVFETTGYGPDLCAGEPGDAAAGLALARSGQ